MEFDVIGKCKRLVQTAQYHDSAEEEGFGTEFGPVGTKL
jgi:hypothetical protein